MKTKVVIADDHPITCLGMKTLLEEDGNYEIIGEATSGREALELILKLKPELVLLDLELGDLDGIEILKKLKKDLPRCKVLIVTVHSENDKIFEAIENNVDGYILKEKASEDMLTAIKEVLVGHCYLDPRITKYALDKVKKDKQSAVIKQKLTKTELETMALVCQGCSNREIAQKLFMAESTVKTHIRNILLKLDKPNRIKAAFYAVEVGLVEPPTFS